jgi:hypothetical protein
LSTETEGEIMPAISFALLLTVSMAVGDSTVPDLETVRARYLATVTSIHTLDCEMRQTQERPQRDLSPAPEAAFTGANLHLWKMRALLKEHINGRGQVSMAVWRGFDGRLYAHWTASRLVTEEEPWSPGGTVKAEKDNLLFEELTVDRLTGETIHAGDFPLTKLILQPGVRIIQMEDVDGSLCVKVAVPRHARSRLAPDQLVVETEVWFDPEHQFLPRLIRWRDFSEGEQIAPREYALRTTRFERVRGEDGGTFTLPAAGEQSTAGFRSTMELVRATVNGTLDTATFRPVFPDSTEVHEELPNQKPRRRIVGNPTERQLLEQKSIDAALKGVSPKSTQSTKQSVTPPQKSAPPSAHPQDDHAAYWRTVWQTVGATVCGLACLFGWRAWRSSRE